MGVAELGGRMRKWVLKPNADLLNGARHGLEECVLYEIPERRPSTFSWDLRESSSGSRVVEDAPTARQLVDHQVRTPMAGVWLIGDVLGKDAPTAYRRREISPGDNVGRVHHVR